MQNWYQKLGDSQLEKLVHAFYERVYASEIISHLFQNPRNEVEAKQFAFLSQFLGGPQRYLQQYGVPKMRFRHLPHAIDQTAKDEWLRCMYEAIQTLDLNEEEKKALWTTFVPLANHMVNR